MANLKSSKKDVRRITKRTAHNRRIKSRLKTLRMNVAKAKDAGDTEATKAAAIALISAYDKAAKTQIVHISRANAIKAKMSPLIFGTAAKAPKPEATAAAEETDDDSGES